MAMAMGDDDDGWTSTWTWRRSGRRRRNGGGNRPHGHGTKPSSFPSWEQTFCTEVCKVPWGKICDAKETLPVRENIANWDDSGALEAFNNAKARYWAEINGLPCDDVTLPGPDLYIDEVDYDAPVDPELVADLYTRPPSPPCEADRDEEELRNLPINPTGWVLDEPSKWDLIQEKFLRPIVECGGGDHEAGDAQQCQLITNRDSSRNNEQREDWGWGEGNAGCVDGHSRATGTKLRDNLILQNNKYAYRGGGHRNNNWKHQQQDSRRDGRNRSRHSESRRYGNSIHSNTCNAKWVPKAACALMNG